MGTSPQTLELLRRVKAGQLRPADGKDLWRAMRVPGLITITDKNGGPLTRPFKVADVAGFKLTRRGEEALAEPVLGKSRAFQTLPRETQHWVSAIKRAFRNKPRGVLVIHDDHNLVIRDDQGVIDTIKMACS